MQRRQNENKHGHNWGAPSSKKPWVVRVTSKWSDTKAGREVRVSWGCIYDWRKARWELDTRISKASAVMRSSEIRKSLNIEPLLLRIERSQLKMVWPCKQNSSGKTLQTSFTCQSKWEKSSSKPRTKWTNYIEDLEWNRLVLHPSEMMDVIEDREVWRLNLELLPPQPSR